MLAITTTRKEFAAPAALSGRGRKAVRALALAAALAGAGSVLATTGAGAKDRGVLLDVNDLSTVMASNPALDAASAATEPLVIAEPAEAKPAPGSIAAAELDPRYRYGLPR